MPQSFELLALFSIYKTELFTIRPVLGNLNFLLLSLYILVNPGTRKISPGKRNVELYTVHITCLAAEKPPRTVSEKSGQQKV